jgi:N-acetyl-anhydromuramyl-L-alanine amidase AmpD
MRKPSQPQWNELQAHYLAKRTGKVQGIVLHDTAGSGTHNDTLYLAHPGDERKVSVDFTVERDGSIWKLNPQLALYHTNHAGRCTEWNGLKNAQVNHGTVGIEIVQKADLSLQPTYPDAQVESTARLCAWLCSHFSLKPSAIVTHRQIITDGSRSDPRRFPFDGEDGFWFHYWQALGREEEYLASLRGQ